MKMEIFRREELKKGIPETDRVDSKASCYGDQY